MLLKLFSLALRSPASWAHSIGSSSPLSCREWILASALAAVTRCRGLCHLDQHRGVRATPARKDTSSRSELLMRVFLGGSGENAIQHVQSRLSRGGRERRTVSARIWSLANADYQPIKADICPPSAFRTLRPPNAQLAEGLRRFAHGGIPPACHNRFSNCAVISRGYAFGRYQIHASTKRRASSLGLLPAENEARTHGSA